MLHHIQKSILHVLAAADSLRYGQIKPKELDGNVFGYHLKQLISDEYVEKTPEGHYALTSKGREYIVHRHEDSRYSAHTIFLVVLKHRENYLLRERKVQPLLGMSGFVHGEPKPGEAVTATAQARLIDKTGIDAELSIRGHALISQYKNGELHSYSHAIILYGETMHNIRIEEDETGKNYWADNESLSDETVLPSTLDIVELLTTNAFFLEKSYYL